jgi:hypothetical protein
MFSQYIYTHTERKGNCCWRLELTDDNNFRMEGVYLNWVKQRTVQQR